MPRRHHHRSLPAAAIVVALVLTVGGACTSRESLAPGSSVAGRMAVDSLIVRPAGEAVAPKQVRPPTRDPQLGSGKPLTIAFGGDVNFEDGLAGALETEPTELLAEVQPLWAGADLVMVNLETAITEGGTPADKKFVFRAPPGAFTALESNGVGVVTMANNHGLDYGVEGLTESLAAARSSGPAGFPLVGVGNNETEAYDAARFVVRGQRISVLGATQVLDGNLIASWTAGIDRPGLANAKDPVSIASAVQRERELADVVVVYVHWGVELEPCPSSAQRTLATQLAEAGADVVVGGHAHVPQGAGMQGSTFVGFGLGNLLFASAGAATADSGVLLVTMTGRRVDGWQWEPVRLRNGRPAPAADPETARAELDELRGCADLAAEPEPQ
jgi:poly-gamma-glutamate synthesis protein (capsule biosynthesis protein)